MRFDIVASSLPDYIKERLLSLNDQRITRDGVLVIKAQTYRSQPQNKEEAVRRLYEIIASITVLPATRRATKPTRRAQKRRLEGKTMRGQVKAMRGKVIG